MRSLFVWKRATAQTSWSAFLPSGRIGRRHKMRKMGEEEIKNEYNWVRCSLYRDDTYEFTNRTFTPILASLAELIRWGLSLWTLSMDKSLNKSLDESLDNPLCLSGFLFLCRCTPKYADNYEWFVELAKNFHSIQTQMVRNVNTKIWFIVHST